MRNYTIKEMYEYVQTIPETIPTPLLMCGAYWYAPEILPPGATDTRPDYMKFFVNNAGTFESDICKKYGSWVYTEPAESVALAWQSFVQSNVVYELTHRTSLLMTEKALNSTYNPVHNYDRHEETKVTTDMTVGAKTQTAPDDSELFFNVGSGSTDTDGDVTTTSDISGNIGVTRSDEMVKAVVNTYSDPMFSMYDVLVSRLIGYSCILVD